ncbi:DeoR/GlpR family DNA-binding transcription regulator [Methylobacterium haplocladii]|uniref:Glycerol-3-phosphate regulon repressor n=1 Tax=Methylobacterium haplocladii TaxID=1176176 RepID=A0A512IJA6_9HYPH|nr:DeoR family transcriptional regulator [Methylobacterium haplocladii]GEO97790.1 glycerol-3-phosphate regulon repressor [Methylobacterium haplocladii]GJD82636.1 Glycerol-3-phosphate regulon repressor [Methylobacterium haplocladii]GLS57577.1 glycerol-3-phosphate regulon repressor [Methylobacterium haplocladii]
MSRPTERNDARQESSAVEARRAAIVAAVRQRGFVTIEALAASHGVTVQTIRRDLNELSAEGRLERYRGGGGLPSSVENVDYADRRVTLSAEKTRIGRLAASRIPSHCSVFINIGTTTEAVARELARHDDLSIITNNLHVALSLAEATAFRIVVAGGTVRRDGAVLGQLTLDTLSQFRVDYAVIGCSGIDEDGTLLDFDYEEVRATQAILAHAKTTFLVADHSKFSRRPMVRVGSLEQVDTLFTDRPPPAGIGGLIERIGVTVAVASDDD